ncbi:hypothetical protein B0O99DRAFT_44590 [Bisporella sp. PMI_857]|nr:hypothetical protein B0O99DRAFT_44590 [Bisporella sp. PMI_857]
MSLSRPPTPPPPYGPRRASVLNTDEQAPPLYSRATPERNTNQRTATHLPIAATFTDGHNRTRWTEEIAFTEQNLAVEESPHIKEGKWQTAPVVVRPTLSRRQRKSGKYDICCCCLFMLLLICTMSGVLVYIFCGPIGSKNTQSPGSSSGSSSSSGSNSRCSLPSGPSLLNSSEQSLSGFDSYSFRNITDNLLYNDNAGNIRHIFQRGRDTV